MITVFLQMVFNLNLMYTMSTTQVISLFYIIARLSSWLTNHMNADLYHLTISLIKEFGFITLLSFLDYKRSEDFRDYFYKPLVNIFCENTLLYEVVACIILISLRIKKGVNKDNYTSPGVIISYAVSLSGIIIKQFVGSETFLFSVIIFTSFLLSIYNFITTKINNLSLNNIHISDILYPVFMLIGQKNTPALFLLLPLLYDQILSSDLPLLENEIACYHVLLLSFYISGTTPFTETTPILGHLIPTWLPQMVAFIPLHSSKERHIWSISKYFFMPHLMIGSAIYMLSNPPHFSLSIFLGGYLNVVIAAGLGTIIKIFL